MFFKLDVLKTFAIFTGKHLCWSHFLTFFYNFIKKRLQYRRFPVKNIYFEEYQQIFTKRSILHVWQRSEYASATDHKTPEKLSFTAFHQV